MAEEYGETPLAPTLTDVPENERHAFREIPAEPRDTDPNGGPVERLVDVFTHPQKPYEFWFEDMGRLAQGVNWMTNKIVPATKASFTFAKDYVLPAQSIYTVVLDWPEAIAPNTRYSFALDSRFVFMGIKALRFKVHGNVVHLTLSAKGLSAKGFILRKNEIAGYGLMAHGSLE